MPPPFLGILMLDTRFPRVAGDVGNPDTFPFPVRVRRVPGATAARVTGPDVAALADAFADGATALAAEGAAGVATTCGFLAVLQAELAARCPVPFASSSLLQVAAVQATLPPGRRVGVLTFSAADLGPAHLAGAGAPADTPVTGLDPDGTLARTIRTDGDRIDAAAATREVVDAGRRLLADHPEVGAVVVECANLPPYCPALRAALRLPVHDPVGFLGWFWGGLPERGTDTFC